MAQKFTDIRIPLTKLSWTPDIPTSALGAAEYNIGANVETTLRGIQPVAGEQEILGNIPGTAIFVTAGYRANQVYTFVVGTAEGRWYIVTPGGVTNVTPGVGSNPSVALPGYSSDMAITDAWNGTICFINDGVNAPMYLLPTSTEFRQYDAAPDNYVWNYTADWSNLSAGFQRIYSTPNVGSILVAGNLTANVISTGTVTNFPYTVRWSQAFGLDSGPTSWEPTITNVANELEVPVRGAVVDGWALGANFYVQSYWDTVVFTPLSYQSGGSAPVLGVRLLTQGRGLLNDRCWATGDGVVYGVDARDIWVFNGSQFASIANQRVRDTFYANLNPTYWSRTFVVNNTARYQFEIYYPSLASTGWCDEMIAYRYDLDVWQPPRQVRSASSACESPIYTANVAAEASRTVVYSQAANAQPLLQKDVGNRFIDAAGNTQPILFEMRKDNISFGQEYSQKILLHRVMPEVVGTGTVSIAIGTAGSYGETPTFLPLGNIEVTGSEPWTQINQNAARVVSIDITGNTAQDEWQLTALDWKLVITEDDR